MNYATDYFAFQHAVIFFSQLIESRTLQVSS